MATTALVKDMLTDGEKVVARLTQEGFDVTTACWLKESENDQWYFYVVSPVVESESFSRAYGRLHTIIRRIPQPLWIDPLEVRLLEPQDPIAKDVLAIHQRAPGPTVCPTRWGGTQLGNLSIEDAYLYPLTNGSTAATRCPQGGV